MAKSDFVGTEPIPELGIVFVGVENRVRQSRFINLALDDRLFEPAVVLLATQLEDPARHRDRNPVAG
jgi:hypothetical protein